MEVQHGESAFKRFKAQYKFQNFKGLHGRHGPGGGPHHAGFGAALVLKGLHIRTETAKTGTALRVKDRQLSFKLVHRSVHIRFPEIEAGSVYGGTGHKIVRAVGDIIIACKGGFYILSGQHSFIRVHFYFRVDLQQALFRQFCLQPAYIPGFINELPVQVGKIHRAEVEHADFPYPRPRQVTEHQRAKAAGAHNGHLGGL